MTAPLAGILLAGGAGTRFRASGGGDKLMHPLADGTPIAVASLRNLIAAVPHVVAVVRPGAAALADALRGAGADVTICDQADEGMGRTLSHAVRHAGDAGAMSSRWPTCPTSDRTTIARVATAVAGGALIAAPAYRGERGHPVGFAAALRVELEASSGDAGARETLRRRSGDVTLVEVDDPAVVRDVDTLDQAASE